FPETHIPLSTFREADPAYHGTCICRDSRRLAVKRPLGTRPTFRAFPLRPFECGAKHPGLLKADRERNASVPITKEMNRCIETCLSCYRTCLGTAMNLCLETGGKHVEPAHFRLMMACAEICRT